MRASLVLTVAAPDEPGLVDALSKTVTAHKGNWEESRMARLAGQFVGILKLTVPQAEAAPLSLALQALASEGFRIHVVQGTSEDPLRGYRKLRLELMGNDREGIVQEISHALAERGINVDALNTECVDAPVSGGLLFKAVASLRCPPGLAIAELQRSLEQLASELMVDIALDEETAGDPEA